MTTNTTNYPYTKVNHLNEWLRQIQAKQTTNIPEDVLTQIQKELNNQGSDLNELTPTHICQILKKLKLTRYKEHYVYILCQITGRQAPTLTLIQQNVIREMFKQMQSSYEKHKPPKRVGFISYGYCIYKICEILEFNEITEMLWLPKSEIKLKELDDLWQKICEDLHWKYIPSISTNDV